MEARLAENYYKYISIVPTRKWPEYIRILGLPESDIDESYYENNEPSEQKYQMLSKWKSYYGYNRENSDVTECLRLAYEELENDAQPQYLNRKLHGRLSESKVSSTSSLLKSDRLISKVLYGAVRSLIPNARKRFAMVKLDISDTEIDAISRNYPRDFEEQGYQMFLVWARRRRGWSHTDMRDHLERYMIDFRNENPQLEQPQSQGSRAGPAASAGRVRVEPTRNLQCANILEVIHTNETFALPLPYMKIFPKEPEAKLDNESQTRAMYAPSGDMEDM